MQRQGTPRMIAVLVLAGAGLLGGWVFGGSAETPDVGTLDPIRVPSPERAESHQLEPGETLGSLLDGQTPLPSQEQHAALLALREEADPTRLSTGTEVTFRWLRDEARDEEGLRGLDVEVSPDEVVQLRRNDVGWDIDVRETPVWADTLHASGEITTDLWSAVVLNPELSQLPRQDRYALIDHLDRVYQWQVDFSRQIYAGDEYRVLFERKVRPDGSMREGRILGAELETGDQRLRAIWYEVEEDGGYYEIDGESVQRAFTTKPLEYRRISSNFNRNRMHPVHQERRAHNGVDYAADSGTQVHATGDGVVTERRARGGYGNVVTVEHSNGFRTRYAHLSGFASGLSVGDRVSQGEVIGYVGMTGTATGPHLHYEMHREGRPMDPLDVEIPSGDPIPDEEWDAWEEHRDAILEMLDAAAEPRAPSLVDLPGVAPFLPRQAADGSSDESSAPGEDRRGPRAEAGQG